jgi:hypothetical protein
MITWRFLDDSKSLRQSARKALNGNGYFRAMIVGYYAPESATAREPVSVPYKLRLRDFTGF